MMRNGILGLLVIILCGSCQEYAGKDAVNNPAGKSLDLNLDNPRDNLTAFVKTRASLKAGEEVVYWWTGTLHSYVPGERSKALFGMTAYNIGRANVVEGGYEFLSREVALYTDPASGRILEHWYNPYIEDSVEVVHVWNDPVNQQFLLEGRYGPWGVNHTTMGNNRIAFNADVLLLYPSPLKKSEYPLHSRSDIYQAAELFQFFTAMDELNDPAVNSAYAEVSWTRVSDWLPWMNMGDRPGYLIYHCRGYKLKNGYQDLPEDIKVYVEKEQPVFTAAPDQFTTPNETSWTYFKKLKEKQ